MSGMLSHPAEYRTEPFARADPPAQPFLGPSAGGRGSNRPAGRSGRRRSRSGPPPPGISEGTKRWSPLAWSHRRWHNAISAYRYRDRSI